MSSQEKILSQYATSSTLLTRRGLYDTNIGVPLTDRIDECLKLSQAKTLLDVGCGYGADIATFTQRYPHLVATGFDISEAQIQDAKNKTPTAAFFVENAQTFQLNESFDRILVRHVLHLLPDPSAVVNRILEHCTSGGRVVFAIHSSHSQPKYKQWREWFIQQTGIGYKAANEKLTLEKSQDLFLKPTWAVQYVEAIETISLTDPEPYLAYIQGQKRWSKDLSEEELQLLLQHVRSEIEKEIAEKGTFTEPSVNGLVVIDPQ